MEEKRQLHQCLLCGIFTTHGRKIKFVVTQPEYWLCYHCSSDERSGQTDNWYEVPELKWKKILRKKIHGEK